MGDESDRASKATIARRVTRFDILKAPVIDWHSFVSVAAVDLSAKPNSVTPPLPGVPDFDARPCRD